MKSDRLNLLLKYLENDPDDAFTHYAIAMEYLKSDPEKSLEKFDLLLEKFPDYLPTYYQAGVLYHDQYELEKAKYILEKGIEVAKKQKNQLTERELKNALEQVVFDLEE